MEFGRDSKLVELSFSSMGVPDRPSRAPSATSRSAPVEYDVLYTLLQRLPLSVSS